MAKKPLRSQLNQIRAWVRQGRTDAWIAHQLEVSTAELREFRRRHELNPEDEAGDLELRDEIEAEIEAAAREREEREAEEAEKAQREAEEAAAREGEREDAGGEEEERPRERDRERERERLEPEEGEEGAEGGGRRRRRRRRGRGGRGKREGGALQATFDHGEEGYGLWLDPAVKDDPVYAEHWAGHRRVEVSIEADQIVIKRSD